MKTGMIATVGIWILLQFASPQARATTVTANTWMENDGRACKSQFYTDDVIYTISGVENNCSNCSKTLICPIEVVKDSTLISPGPVTISDVTIMYYDGNDAQQDFYCRPYLRDSNGGNTLGALWYAPAGRSAQPYPMNTWWNPFGNLNMALSNYQQNGLMVACTLPQTGGGGRSIIYMQKATFTYNNVVVP